MHGEGSVLCPVREAGAAGAQRACERAQPRRAAISTFQIAPPRNSTHFGTSHAPRKSLEAALGNAWSSSSLVATGRTGNSNLTADLCLIVQYRNGNNKRELADAENSDLGRFSGHIFSREQD